ncbi:precorrin-6A reductase [Sedimentibacter sp. MB31-C6]|uniref:precorrin-6A reductase n=1 Tax=Sedimentibacter sp. MB31-C6 TaxID=3109366 RepID=UPI002DDD8E52|nr:precorrin-6A reductase [Sedimentibacter sp. MB36-C1]WSI04521.1 precorrin-6A reductase [Sedimentibacter sp. MB36-C1]
MKNPRICIFGGTTEGRLFAKYLSQINLKADLFITTNYGQQFIENIKNIRIYQRRIDDKEMIYLFSNNKYDYVVDATHPFARIVTENLIKSTTYCNINYFRIIRESAEYNNNYIYFDELIEIINYLNNCSGNILLTTGSKDLDEFTKIMNYEDRIFVRILPMESSLKRCIDLGYKNKNIICMQGPFTEEMNSALINGLDIKYLVTKESSNTGGFNEKVQACINSRTKCLVIRKPHEEGMTLKEICNIFRELIK